MNILGLVLFIAVVAFTSWQVVLLVKDIRKRRKIKKQIKNKEVTENGNSN